MGAWSRIQKMFGGGAPQAIQDAEAASGMDMARAFSPGLPLNPYDGYSRAPRAHDFPTGYNIAARPRRNERISFDTLRGLVEAYDVAQMCIWHRIDSVRSLDWALVAADGVEGDVGKWVEIGKACLEKPDRVTPFHSWIAKYAYDILAFDAGALYRIRNNAGQPIGLEVVDGTTIAPLLDYWGRTPRAEKPGDEAPPAYVQFANGVPWNWLTLDDLIYVPFRPVSNSPYGRSPLETIMLNANTDLRFQAYFLQRFTDGNIPEAFASAPETWSPSQIEEFQQQWDALMLSDQAAKSQIKWIPGGGKIEWSNEKDFTSDFSLFLMRKTAAAYHVTPQDLGFTEDVNRSAGETQVDNQFRVGDLPLIQHVQGVLTSFLQDDLKLPLKFAFDTGQEKEDRLQVAQADAIYIQNGVISASEPRQRVYGLEEPDGIPVPRYVFSTRAGPIPLSALYAVAGQVDPDSAAPLPGADLPHKPFAPIEGVAPQKPPDALPLAVQRYPADNPAAADNSIRSDIAADTPTIVNPTAPTSAEQYGQTMLGDVSKEGIAVSTGIVGSPMLEDDDEDKAELAKSELAAFRRFAKARARDGRWRDFTFTAVPVRTAHQMNADARAQVRKAAGQVAAAGLCVQAADTGRVLMLQRAFDPADPASGMWEFPGGCLEDGETPLTAAVREWQEEAGMLLPADIIAAVRPGWTSADGVYVGHVVTVPAEGATALVGRGQVTNPDDPDGDIVEAVAWWAPALLTGNPAIRAELSADLALVLEALQPAGEVVKADPKVSWRDGAPKTPQHAYDVRLTDHYTPIIQAALGKLVSRADIERVTAAVAGAVKKSAPLKPGLASEIASMLGDSLDTASLEQAVRQIIADGWLAGAHAAGLQLPGGAATVGGVDAIDWSTWEPGDVHAAIETADGGLAAALDDAGIVIRGITGSALDSLGGQIADGLLNGDSVDTIAGSLGLDDPARAERIAHTETARAVDRATQATYGLNGVGTYDVILSDGACPECEDVASGNPYLVGDGGQVPVHPYCRCSSSPNVDSIVGENITAVGE